ncbi:MAG TPA: c-type cytochrome [Helicobacteraceae bacterium]|nr:c-type cytochrome [Helicobacteraceae bacterium]
MKKIALTLLVASVSLMAADGAALYKKCAACHGAKAEKKALGKSGIINTLSAAEIETELKGYKAGTLNKKGMGALMKGQVASYSDADIAAVAAYIATLK